MSNWNVSTANWFRLKSMRRQFLKVSLVFAAACVAQFAHAACQLPAQIPQKQKALPRDNYNTQAFVDEAVKQLGNHYKGYVVLLVGRGGRIIAEAEYGFARTSCETAGEKRFTKRTQTAWGSVTKFVTGAIVIDKTERSNARNLDEAMFDFLPARWKPDVHAGHRPVTIRQLLQHRSGFGDRGSNLRQRLSQPPEKRVGSRKYNNANFAMFQVMGRFFKQGVWDTLEAGYVPGEITYGGYIAAHGLSIYKEMLDTRIRKPLGIKLSCNQADHAGDNHSYWYRNAGSKKGYRLVPQDYRGCSTGGLVMSSVHMAKILHAVTRTNDIISKSNYSNLMAQPNNERLVWDGFQTTTGGSLFKKNGARNRGGGANSSLPGNGSGSIRAEIMAFPNGMSGLIVTNSATPSGVSRIGNMLKAAFEKGAQ